MIFNEFTCQNGSQNEAIWAPKTIKNQVRSHLGEHFGPKGVPGGPQSSIWMILNAKSYALSVLAEKIQDEKINITRLAVLGMKIPSPSEKDKTSFCFDFSDIDKPGQLINVMKLFSDAKINITKIESRPSKKELGKYIFWMDINGHIKDQKLKNIFDQVKQMTSMLKIIGSYPEATNII